MLTKKQKSQNYNTTRFIPLNFLIIIFRIVQNKYEFSTKILISTWFQILELSITIYYDPNPIEKFSPQTGRYYRTPFSRSFFSLSVKMSEHPFQAVFQTFSKVSNSVQTHLSNLIGQPHRTSPTTKTPLISVSSSSKVGPSENDSTHLQPQDIINKVTTLIHNTLLSFFSLNCSFVLVFWFCLLG